MCCTLSKQPGQSLWSSDSMHIFYQFLFNIGFCKTFQNAYSNDTCVCQTRSNGWGSGKKLWWDRGSYDRCRGCDGGEKNYTVSDF